VNCASPLSQVSLLAHGIHVLAKQRVIGETVLANVCPLKRSACPCV
jgi:hypothetical protein